MAKKFFYVCGGLLMLALALHLTSQNTEAQIGGLLEWAQVNGAGVVSAGGGRTIYVNGGYGTGTSNPYAVPGSGRVVGGGLGSTVGNVGSAYYAVLETGEIYRSDIIGVGSGEPQPWVLAGNMFGSPTPSATSSWGAVKARYR